MPRLGVLDAPPGPLAAATWTPSRGIAHRRPGTPAGEAREARARIYRFPTTWYTRYPLIHSLRTLVNAEISLQEREMSVPRELENYLPWRSTLPTCSTIRRMDSNDSTDVQYRERTLTIRVHGAELDQWKQAAWVRKVSLSEWVRRVLTATAESTLKDSK